MATAENLYKLAHNYILHSTFDSRLVSASKMFEIAKLDISDKPFC